MNLRVTILVLAMLCFGVPGAYGDGASQRKQIGYVRTQSLFGVESSMPVSGAYIRFDNSALSTTNKKGEFEFNMQDYDDDTPFRIDAVYHERYKLLSDRCLKTEYRYSPHVPIEIIMKDEAELDNYVSKVVAKNIQEQERIYNEEITRVKNDAKIAAEEKDQIINRLSFEVLMLKSEVIKQAKNFLSESDYQTADSLSKAIYEAIFMGDLSKAEALDNSRGSYDSMIDLITAKRSKAAEDRESYIRNTKDAEFLTEQAIESVRTKLYIASERLQLDSIRVNYDRLISLEPSNIKNYIDAGGFAENILCDLAAAKGYYELANEMSRQNESSLEDRMDALLNLAKLLMLEGQYDDASTYLGEALALCADGKKMEQAYRTYLLLGDLEKVYGNNTKALEYYSLVSNDHVKTQFNKQYVEALIHVADVKLTYGQFKEANSIFDELHLDGIHKYTIQDFELTHSLRTAYAAYLVACNEYEEALEYIEESERLLNDFHSGENHYTANVLFQKSAVLFYLGRIMDAKECVEKARRITEDIFGKTHPDYITSLVLASECLLDIGEFAVAEEMLMYALGVQTDKFGEYGFNTLNVRSALIRMYEYIQETDKQLEQIKICKDILSRNNLSGSTMMLNLEYREGLISDELGGPQRNLKIALKTVELVKKEVGENTTSMMSAYSQLGDTYIALGDSKNASDYFKKALDLSIRINGKNHVFTHMQEMHALLSLPMSGKDQIDKTLKSIDKVEKNLIEILGKDSYSLRQVYQPLSLYYSNVGDFHKARDFAQKYYDIVSRTFGEDHRLIVDPLLSFVSAYMAGGEINSAEETVLKARDIIIREYGEDSGYMLTCRMAYINVLIARGKVKDARQEVEALTSAIESTVGRDNMMMASALLLASRVETDPKSAEGLYDALLRIYGKLLDEDNYMYADLYARLAEYECVCSNIDAALEYYDKATNNIVHNFGENSSSEAKILPVLLNIYCQKGDFQSAERVLERLKQMEKIHGEIAGVDMPLAEVRYYSATRQTTIVVDVLNSRLAKLREDIGEGSIWECQYLNSLADAYISMAQTDKAKECLELSAKISKAHLEDDMLYNADAYKGQAILLLNQPSVENCAKANNIYRSLKAQYIKQYGSKHPLTISMDGYIGMCYLMLYQIMINPNDYKEACRYLKQNLEATIDYYDEDVCVPIAEAHASMANCYDAGGEFSLARLHYFYALECLESLHGKDHLSTIGILANISGSYMSQYDLDNAMEFLQRAYDVIEKNPESARGWIPRVYGSMAQINVEKGDFETAAELLEKSIEVASDAEFDIAEVMMLDLYHKSAAVNFRLGDETEGFDLLKKSLTLAKESKVLTPVQKYGVGHSGIQLLMMASPDLKLMDKYLTLAEEQIPDIEKISNNAEYVIYMYRSMFCKAESDMEGYKSNLLKAYSLAKKCKMVVPEHIQQMKAEVESLEN